MGVVDEVGDQVPKQGLVTEHPDRFGDLDDEAGVAVLQLGGHLVETHGATTHGHLGVVDTSSEQQVRDHLPGAVGEGDQSREGRLHRLSAAGGTGGRLGAGA